MRLIHLGLLFVTAVAPLPSLGNEPADCADYVLSEQQLRNILYETLGNYSTLVNNVEVRVNPTDSGCYLKMRLELKTVGCAVSGCSTAVAEGQKIGIRQFDVEGCDFLFDSLRLERTVKTSFADVRQRIMDHCRSRRFTITEAIPELSNAVPQVRLRLAPVR